MNINDPQMLRCKMKLDKVFIEAGKKTPLLKPAQLKSLSLELQMNDEPFVLSKQIFAATKDARIPEEIQQMAQQGVEKSREIYRQLNATATEGVKALEDVLLSSQTGLKTLSDKVMSNAAANTEAAFEAAQSIARAKSLPEAARLQSEYMMQQFSIAGAQVKELFELTVGISQQTFGAASQVAFRSLEQVKKLT